MSFSFKNDRMARSISAASELPDYITSSKACSAEGFQCQLSSKASICAWTLMPVRRLEQHIVIGVGIERWIEIDEIDAFVSNVLAQNGEIVAIKKRVLGGCFLHVASPRRPGLLATRSHSSNG